MSTPDRPMPDDPLSFIRKCILNGRVFWTYHVHMRLQGRFIPREAILKSVDSYEIVESYPEDKYLASYLLLARRGDDAFHVLFAADVTGENVRIVTAYRPGKDEWEDDLKTRRTPR